MNVLRDFVEEFSIGIETADARKPTAQNSRTKKAFKPGIGPHSETQAIELVLKEVRDSKKGRSWHIMTGVPYPGQVRQKCDLALRSEASAWFIEVKLFRMLGDNGKVNDNIITHILSPYRQHRSAVFDCEKLVESGFNGRKAILIYGFDHDEWPLDAGVAAFECLVAAGFELGPRCKAVFTGLCHPIHQKGAVYGWELMGKRR